MMESDKYESANGPQRKDRCRLCSGNTSFIVLVEEKEVSAKESKTQDHLEYSKILCTCTVIGSNRWLRMRNPCPLVLYYYSARLYYVIIPFVHSSSTE